MSIDKLVIFLFLLICCFSVVGQPLVTGKVLDINGNGLVGATIQEVGTSNGTVCDLEGNFSLQLQDTGSVKITFIGYLEERLSIQSDSSVEIHMSLDSVADALNGVISCFIFVPRTSKTGLNFGSLQSTLGLESQNFIYSLWRLNLKLISDFKWRFTGDDPYFNLRIRRFDIINNGNFSMGLRGEYKALTYLDNRLKFYSVSPEFAINGYIFSTGYAMRANSSSELDKSNRGFNLEFQKYLLNRIALRVGGIYWGDDWQYNVNITAQIPRTRLFVGAGWEQIGDWRELDFSILYQLDF